MIKQKGKEGRLSDTLRLLMHQQRSRLQAMAGQPPQGQCVDCKRDILATELAVKCDKCDQFCCVRCVDAHDHIHVALAQMGMLQAPGAR